MKIFNFVRSTKHAALYVCATLLVAACGGGGGDPGSSNPGGGGTVTPRAANIDLSSSATAISSGGVGSSGITITAIVKDSGNVAIPNAPITFRTNFGTLTASGETTNEKGVATAVLTAPSDTTAETRANRDIVVAATAGTASKEIKVKVTGTRLAMSGDNAMGLGDTARYRVVAQDSSGNLIPGARLNVSAVKSSSVIDPTQLTTDQNGEATFTYTPKEAGADTISVAGLGASTQMQVTVGASVLRLNSDALLWDVREAHAVEATVRDSNGRIPPTGTVVTFSTTRGCVLPTSTISAGCSPMLDVATQADGTAKAWLSAADVGDVVVSATAGAVGGATGVLEARFISTMPTQITLQANPNALRPSTANSNNSSSLEVLVRDREGNPVQDVTVTFTTMADPSGGRLAAASARTDVNGRALNTYYAGPRGTGTNGVQIRATVSGMPNVFSDTTLTVGGDALTIGLGASNFISAAGNNTLYRLFHTVYVTNAAGVSVASQPVTISIRPGSYAVGVLCWLGEAWGRVSATSTTYANEDRNFNGTRDPGEPDPNGDGRLSPGFVANVVPADSEGNVTGAGGSTLTLTTGADGFAYFQLQYAKDYANWAQMQIQASARVGGSESTNSMAMSWLWGLADDYMDQNIRPPGNISPYGAGGHSSAQCPAVTTTP